ncbi:MAG: restriction endonuclease [Oscillospiraceae bacterium]|nr:restriction endonuclease [Oscillospiraceae bacterium]
MAIPSLNELYREVLLTLGNGEPHSNKQLGDAIAKRKHISKEDLAVRMKDGVSTVFRYRLRWVKTRLKKDGLVEYLGRDAARITDAGRRVLAEGMHPSAERSEDDQQEQTPGERIEAAFLQINEVLKSEILSEIMSQDSVFFEHLVVKLLLAMGYGGALDGEGIVTPLSRDGGIDGIIREDKLGFNNIYIQAKRWALSKTIGRPEVQTFVGAIANKTGKGLFITTAKFSSEAVQCAKENHLVLVDGDKLAELMIEYGVGVSTLQTYEMKKLDTDFFTEQD